MTNTKDTSTNNDGLKSLAQKVAASKNTPLTEPQSTEPKLDKKGRAYATGKRKSAIARLWLKAASNAGKGTLTINGKPLTTYFAAEHLRALFMQPLTLLDDEAAKGSRFDILATCKGSGLSGQAGALRHALAKALAIYKPERRTDLKTKGLLTRDARVVERKKYGQPKARKKFQFSKR